MSGVARQWTSGILLIFSEFLLVRKESIFDPHYRNVLESDNLLYLISKYQCAMSFSYLYDIFSINDY